MALNNLLTLAFPDEEQPEEARERKPVLREVPPSTLDQSPVNQPSINPDPAGAWARLQRLVRSLPGLRLETDGNGGVWLLESDNSEGMEEAQRLFLEALPVIEKNLARISSGHKHTHPARVTPGMVRAWRKARGWLFIHMDELTGAGWTPKRLFAAGRFRYPHGEWGIAWSKNWTRKGVEIALEGRSVSWTWQEEHKTIKQTARP